VAAGMTDLDEIAVAPRVPGPANDTVRHGPDGGARGRRVVDSVVCPAHTQHRVEPAAREGRADPAVLERSPEEGATQRLAVRVVVVLHPFGGGECIGLVIAPVDRELDAEDAARPCRSIRPYHPLIEETEPVAGPEVT